MANDHESTPLWLAAARTVYRVAFPVLFVASVLVYGIGHSGMPKAVPLRDGSTAFFLRSWVGAIYWPAATFFFMTYLAIGYYLGIGKHQPVTSPRGIPRRKAFIAVMTFGLVLALVLPEIGRESPFRHFYCIVVSRDAVLLRSGLWLRRIPRSEIANVTYDVREYKGTKDFRFPVLRIREACGKVWRSVDEQCVAGQPKLLCYESIMREARGQIIRR